MSRVSRRELLRLAGATGTGLLGVALGACAPGGPTTPATAVPSGAQPTAKAAPAQTTAAATAWDQLVAAAQKEGKIVVSGPPVPEARTKLPEAFKQRFNTITPIGYINTTSVAPDELRTVDDLLKPKWKGKLASYDPSVNGGGLIAGSVIYTVKGADFAKQLYQGQEIAYTRDYQQIADWVAHDSYPIGLAITPVYMNQYQGTVPGQELA